MVERWVYLRMLRSGCFLHDTFLPFSHLLQETIQSPALLLPPWHGPTTSLWIALVKTSASFHQHEHFRHQKSGDAIVGSKSCMCKKRGTCPAKTQVSRCEQHSAALVRRWKGWSWFRQSLRVSHLRSGQKSWNESEWTRVGVGRTSSV